MFVCYDKNLTMSIWARNAYYQTALFGAQIRLLDEIVPFSRLGP